MATKQEFDRIWQTLLRSYPNFVKDSAPDLLAGTFRMYERILSDLPADLLEVAVLQHIATNKWFPAISELRGAVLAATAPAHRTAMEAWGEVLNAMNSGGMRMMGDGDGYYPPEWSEPILARVVTMMGWRELCNSKDQMADRAHFMRAYDALVQREREDANMLPMMRQLAGRLAETNKLKRLES